MLLVRGWLQGKARHGDAVHGWQSTRAARGDLIGGYFGRLQQEHAHIQSQVCAAPASERMPELVREEL